MEVIDNSDYVAACVKHAGIAGDWVMVIPDMGAYKKAFELIGKLPQGLKPVGVTVCTKHRNMNTGEITGTAIVDGRELIKGHHCVIIDDICDGGRTFEEIGKLISLFHPLSLSLIVSHGIFSQGLRPFRFNFYKIYTTTSVVGPACLDNDDRELLSVYDVFTGQIE